MIKRLGLMLALVLGLVVMGNSTGKVVAAEDGGKGGGARGPRAIPTADAIEEKLGEKLTDDQKKKITDIHDAIAKKDADLEATDTVKKLRDEMKAADGPAKREYFGKIKEAKGGFEPFTEYKTQLAGILSEAQIAKAFPQRQRGGGAGGDTKKKDGGDAPAK